jgi:hypothetical protein
MASHRLRQTLAQLQLKWGDHIVVPAADRVSAVAATGYPALDAQLGGGLALPSLTAMRSSGTSGATTAALHTLARNQHEHDLFGAYIDPHRRFDPQLADRLGVDADRLLLSRPSSADAVVTIVRDLLRHGKAGVVIVDMGLSALLPGPEDLRRLNDALKRSESVVIVLNSAANIPAAVVPDVRLRFERQAWIVCDGFHVGLRARVEIARRQQPDHLQWAEFDIRYGDLE